MPFQFYSLRNLNEKHEVIDQLGACTDGNVVVSEGHVIKWYTAGGIQLIKQLAFPLEPLDAKLFRFVVAAAGAPKLALAVLLPNDDLHICLASGETYDIHLPCPVRSMIALSRGLLFQRDTYGVDARLRFMLLTHPLAPVTTVCYHER